MTKAEDVRSFYNDLFFENNRPKMVRLEIAIKAGSQEIVIPGIEVSPLSTIDEIIRSFYAYLHQNGPLPANAKAAKEDPDLINFEVIKYKGNRYYVEEYPEDRFMVRKENGETISLKSPTTKAIIKKYKDDLNPKPV